MDTGNVLATAETFSALRRESQYGRLLVWYDAGAVHTVNPGNMPGVTHGTGPWRHGGGGSEKAVRVLSAANSLRTLEQYCDNPNVKHSWQEFRRAIPVEAAPIPRNRIPLLAREEYCHSWYQAALNGRLDNIDICTHYTKSAVLAPPVLERDQVSRSGHPDGAPAPAALLRKAEKGEHRSTVQIVRTQPEDKDHSIRDIYFQATKNAALATGYMYLENQYFQHEEWAQRLMATRKNVVALWRKACGKAGLDIESMHIMHVFVVIPVPERPEMVPNTYDTLATLGQQAGLGGQVKRIQAENDRVAHEKSVAAQRLPADELGRRVNSSAALPEVVQHANGIDKPTQEILKEQFGLRICTAMLNVCGLNQGGWGYREIYIHSKLMLSDDIFITLGSANLNQRSMVSDSELNLATTDSRHASALRTRIWSQLSGGDVTGGDGGNKAIAQSFKKWEKLMKANQTAKSEGKKMTGFILPLEDARNSIIRLG